jgi:alkylhydroperoxidase family enzyme
MPTLAALDPVIPSGRFPNDRVPNMLRLLANSPPILDLYMRFNAVFQEAKMSPKLRSAIAAYMAQRDGCDYHLSVTYAYARQQPNGATADELTAARRGESADPKIAVALRFVAQVVDARGAVPASAVDALHQAGYGDEEIVEIVAMIALATFRDYFNLVAQTDIDVPLVRTRSD